MVDFPASHVSFQVYRYISLIPRYKFSWRFNLVKNLLKGRPASATCIVEVDMFVVEGHFFWKGELESKIDSSKNWCACFFFTDKRVYIIYIYINIISYTTYYCIY